jgi:hypothetical protein
MMAHHQDTEVRSEFQAAYLDFLCSNRYHTAVHNEQEKHSISVVVSRNVQSLSGGVTPHFLVHRLLQLNETFAELR